MRTVKMNSAGLVVAGFFVSVVMGAKPAENGMFERLRAAASSKSGWVEQKDSYRTFSVQELYGIIDGGAADYEKQGLKNGVLVSYKNGDRVLEIYFDDFGKSGRARAMVEQKKKSMSTPKKIPEVNFTPAFYDDVLGGCIASWAQGDFYVEMTLTGYVSPEKAASDAAALIETLRPVIGK